MPPPRKRNRAAEFARRTGRQPIGENRELHKTVADMIAWHGTRIESYHALPGRMKDGRIITAGQGSAAKGWFDWTLIGAGGIMFREEKGDGGRVLPGQERLIAVVKAMGHDADIWGPEDLISGRIARELQYLARPIGGRP